MQMERSDIFKYGVITKGYALVDIEAVVDKPHFKKA
jgi:hypothetical protein